MTKELNKERFARMLREREGLDIPTEWVEKSAGDSLVYCNMEHLYMYKVDKDGDTHISKTRTEFSRHKSIMLNTQCHHYIHDEKYNVFIAYRRGDNQVSITRYSTFSGTKLGTYYRQIKTTAKGDCFDFNKRYYINRTVV